MVDLISVPDVTGSPRATAEAKLTSAGLAVGAVTTSNSVKVAAGGIVATTPNAGSQVNQGSAVDLVVSSGPTQVTVPDVVGLTRAAAETTLTNANLAIGVVKTAESHVVPANGVNATRPAAGDLVDEGSKIELELSSGPGANWYSALPTIAILIIVLILLVVVIIGLYSAGFLASISEEKSARGLITFLIAIVTVGIALILVISNIISQGADAEKQFDRGKQVLTTMIGVLGTIVGFYFGTAAGPQTPQPGAGHQMSVTNSLPDGGVGKAYSSPTVQTAGGTPPLHWVLDPALPATLTLDPVTGILSGTPTAPLPKTKYKATITDSATPPNTLTEEFTLEIKP